MTRERLVPRVQKNCGTESRTKQSFKDECDINVVMRKFANGGQLPESAKLAPPTYGDFGESQSYLDAQLTVMKANEDFARLPSRVRKACDNDPARFLQMVLDPDQREVLEDLGLANKHVPEQLDLAGLPKSAETPQGGNEKPAQEPQTPAS